MSEHQASQHSPSRQSGLRGIADTGLLLPSPCARRRRWLASPRLLVTWQKHRRWLRREMVLANFQYHFSAKSTTVFLAGRTPRAQSVCKWVDMGGCCLSLAMVVVWVLRQVLGVGNNARFKCKTFGLILEKHMGWMPLANFMYWEVLPHMGSWSYTLPYLFLAGASIFPSAIFWPSPIICLVLPLQRDRRVHICKDTNGYNIHALHAIDQVKRPLHHKDDTIISPW